MIDKDSFLVVADYLEEGGAIFFMKMFRKLAESVNQELLNDEDEEKGEWACLHAQAVNRPESRRVCIMLEFCSPREAEEGRPAIAREWGRWGENLHHRPREIMEVSSWEEVETAIRRGYRVVVTEPLQTLTPAEASRIREATERFLAEQSHYLDRPTTSGNDLK